MKKEGRVWNGIYQEPLGRGAHKENFVHFQNPRGRNPLGRVNEAVVVSHSDDHFPSASTIDPTVGRFGINKITYTFFQELFSHGEPTWYEDGRARLFALALWGWPSAVKEFFLQRQSLLDKPVLFVNGGDDSWDGARKGDGAYSRKIHKEIYGVMEDFVIRQRERLGFGDTLPLAHMSLPGDHDPDPRPFKDKCSPILDYYEVLGPSSMIQAIGDEHKVAILGLDTNLFHWGWQRGVYDQGRKGLQEIEKAWGRPLGTVETIADREEEFTHVKEIAESRELTEPLRKVYLYRLIQEKTKELLSHMREASNVKELIVFGHDPGITKQIVHRLKAGKVHMFTGHLHKGFRQTWIDKWQRVRYHLGHASPSWGAGGVEQVISPFGYAIHIDTWGIREIVPISPEKYMREFEGMI